MKVIIQLKGGLGNQMFQYAFTKYISEKTGRKIVIDLSFLNRRVKRLFKSYKVVFNCLVVLCK
jgi:hypothetical protein